MHYSLFGYGLGMGTFVCGVSLQPGAFGAFCLRLWVAGVLHLHKCHDISGVGSYQSCNSELTGLFSLLVYTFLAFLCSSLLHW